MRVAGRQVPRALTPLMLLVGVLVVGLLTSGCGLMQRVQADPGRRDNTLDAGWIDKAIDRAIQADGAVTAVELRVDQLLITTRSGDRERTWQAVPQDISRPGPWGSVTPTNGVLDRARFRAQVLVDAFQTYAQTYADPDRSCRQRDVRVVGSAAWSGLLRSTTSCAAASDPLTVQRIGARRISPRFALATSTDLSEVLTEIAMLVPVSGVQHLTIQVVDTSSQHCHVSADWTSQIASRTYAISQQVVCWGLIGEDLLPATATLVEVPAPASTTSPGPHATSPSPMTYPEASSRLFQPSQVNQALLASLVSSTQLPTTYPNASSVEIGWNDTYRQVVIAANRPDTTWYFTLSGTRLAVTKR